MKGLKKSALVALVLAGGLFTANVNAKAVTCSDIEDTTKKYVVNEGETVELNIDGCNLTGGIENKGTLTINGDGKVSTKSGYLVNNMGTLTINGGDYSGAPSGSAIETGWAQNAPTDRRAYTTINGGTYTGGMNVFKVDDRGELTFNKGTVNATVDNPGDTAFDENKVAIQVWNKAVINGGTFNGQVRIENGGKPTDNDALKLTIKNGTFNGYVTAYNGGDLRIDNGTFNNLVVIGTDNSAIINGGTFNGTVKASVNSQLLNGGKGLNITKGTYKEVVAEKNGKYYIDGGTFSTEPKKETISEGAKAYKISDDKYVVATPDKLEEKVTVNKTADTSDSDKKLITTEARNLKVAGYYNVDLDLILENTKVDQKAESTEEKKVILPIPEDIPKLKDGYVRKYTVIRLHDGKAESLAATDNNDGTVTVLSNKFSVYALAYEDTKKGVLDDVPKTGDVMPAIITISIMALGIALVALRSKKNVERI